MKQLNNWILVCLSGLLSCTAGDVLDDPSVEGEERVTLRVETPVVGSPAETRAGTENLPQGVTLRVAAYLRKADAPGTPVDITTTAPTAEATYVVGADGALTACTVNEAGTSTGTTATPFVVYKGTYDFYAVSPARPLAKNGSTSHYEVQMQRNEDVMTSSQQGAEITRANATVSLATFVRQCAKVIVKVIPKEITSTDHKIVVTKLKATSVTLKNISAPSATLPVGFSGVIAPTAATTATFTNFEPVPADDDPKNLQLTRATNLLFPRNSALLEVTATVDYQESGATATTKTLQNTQNTIAFEAGKSYEIILSVDNNASELGISVVEGVEDSTEDNQIGEDIRPLIGNLQVCKTDGGMKNWSAANSYCNGLTEEEKSDWRLPSKDELVTMYNNKSSLQNTAGFTAFVTIWYWSSTVTDSGNHWIVTFSNGGTLDGYDLYSNYVRCVRDK